MRSGWSPPALGGHEPACARSAARRCRHARARGPRCRATCGGAHETLGRGLAELHATRDARPGLDEDGFIASLPQSNTRDERWHTFYFRHRILPLANDVGLGGEAVRLEPELEALLAEPPMSLLHGDLWSGNVHHDAGGEPCLIDPAVYFGDREIDLAMLALFGGLHERTQAAYDEMLPPRPGWQERRALYQLWPLLVHAKLFGVSYAHQAREIIRRFS